MGKDALPPSSIYLRLDQGTDGRSDISASTCTRRFGGSTAKSDCIRRRRMRSPAAARAIRTAEDTAARTKGQRATASALMVAAAATKADVRAAQNQLVIKVVQKRLSDAEREPRRRTSRRQSEATKQRSSEDFPSLDRRESLPRPSGRRARRLSVGDRGNPQTRGAPSKENPKRRNRGGALEFSRDLCSRIREKEKLESRLKTVGLQRETVISTERESILSSKLQTAEQRMRTLKLDKRLLVEELLQVHQHQTHANMELMKANDRLQGMIDIEKTNNARRREKDEEIIKTLQKHIQLLQERLSSPESLKSLRTSGHTADTSVGSLFGPDENEDELFAHHSENSVLDSLMNSFETKHGLEVKVHASADGRILAEGSLEAKKMTRARAA